MLVEPGPVLRRNASSSAVWAKSMGDSTVSSAMEFTFSDDQEALRGRSASSRGREPDALRAERWESEDGTTEEVWRQPVELGWDRPARPPRPRAASASALVDLVVVQEEMGRVPSPAPTSRQRSSPPSPPCASASPTAAAGGSAPAPSPSTASATATPSTGCAPAPARRAAGGASPASSPWCSTATVPTGCLSRPAPRRPRHLPRRAPRGGAGPDVGRRPQVARPCSTTRPAEPVGPDGDHTAMYGGWRTDANVALCAELVGGWSRPTTWRSSTPRSGCSSAVDRHPSR